MRGISKLTTYRAQPFNLRAHSELRVLHVYRTYFPDAPGGLQEAIRQIALSGRPFGVDARIFCLTGNPCPDKLEVDGLSVLRARSWAAPASCDLGGLSSFRQFASAAKWAEVIHYHHPWPFSDVLDLLTRTEKPKIMTYHSDVVRQRVLGLLYRPLMRYTLSRMWRIVATSPTYARTSRVLSGEGVHPRVTVIPLGIDDSPYQTSSVPSLPARLELGEDEPFFLFIGVLRYYKGLHVLVEAARKVSARVVIAGSGPEEARLRHLVSQHGINNVLFAGQITDEEKVALLTHCYAMVLPSHLRSEAFGMVLVEASMFAKPMITCEIGTGTSFVNLDEETGLVIRPQDPEALANAMNSLLQHSALARAFGRAARQRYEALFSGPALGQAYAKLYRDALRPGQEIE